METVNKDNTESYYLFENTSKYTIEEQEFLRALEYIDDEDDNTYGKTKLLKLPLDNIICMAQVRDDHNGAFDELKELIGARLINNPDIAIMNKDGFLEYISFVNGVHGSEHKIEDFEEQKYLGYYCVAMAGNTRTLGMQARLKENPESKKYVACKVDINPTPEQILQIQIAENTYQRPKLESKIRSLVEAYELGKASGKWNTVSEFRNTKGVGLSHYAAEIINHVSSLPPRYREFIYNHTIKANTGAALGWALNTVKNYHVKIGYGKNNIEDLSETQREEVQKINLAWLQETVAHIQNEKLNGPAARRYIEGLVNEMKAFLNNDEIKMSFDLPELTNGQMLQEKRKRIERNSRQIILAMGESGIRATVAAIKLHQELHPEGKEIKTIIGQKATKAVIEGKRDLLQFAEVSQ